MYLYLRYTEVREVFVWGTQTTAGKTEHDILFYLQTRRWRQSPKLEQATDVSPPKLILGVLLMYARKNG